MIDKYSIFENLYIYIYIGVVPIDISILLGLILEDS